MCRMLFINLAKKDDVRQYIESFALKCQNSFQYQGDGFGVSFIDENGQIKTIKSLKPIWASSELIQTIPYTTFALVHARSAFGESTIGDIENNQPFGDDNFLFAFNGNLRSVKLKTQGKIGAHKIFNFFANKIKNTNFHEAMQNAINEIIQNTGHVKALNIIAIKNKDIFVQNTYGENEDSKYFNLWISQNPQHLIISSEKLDTIDMESLGGKGGFNYQLFQKL